MIACNSKVVEQTKAFTTISIGMMSAAGKIAAIDEETFWYFLEVLPPKYQKAHLFAFAEGAEALRLFWRKAEAYFCRQLTWDDTTEFCRLARIPLPS